MFFRQPKGGKMDKYKNFPHAPPLEVINLLNIRSHIILPVMLVISTIANILCLHIVNRKKIKKNSISIHLQYLVAVDLTTNLFYTPQLFYEEGCIQTNLVWAWYKAHLGSAMIYYLRSLTMHLLSSLTADRLMGVACNRIYQKSIRYTKTKLFIIWAYVTAMCLPGLYFGTILKLNEGWLVKSMRNITDNPGLEIYKSILTIIMIIIPSIILITMSVILTIKIYQINKLSRKNHRYRRNACAVLVLNATFIIIISLHMSIKIIKRQDEHYCYSSIYQEAWLLGTEIMSLTWSVVNVLVFLVICREYKHQVMISMSNWNLHHRHRPETVQLRKVTHFTI